MSELTRPPLPPFGLAGRLLGAVVLIYGFGFAVSYSATPLGLYPVLDGREILVLARAIANGTLPAEPFYRAPLYPALIAGYVKLGLDGPDLALAARFTNLALHFTSTFLVARIALVLWRRRVSALLAAGLFGLHPVVLHFVVDPLDITLATTLMLTGLLGTVHTMDERSRGAWLLAGAALALALATLARPQMLTVVLGWWVFVLIQVGLRRRAALALVTTVLTFAFMAATNYALSGEARVLPWQGAFNLWAANHRGADGRYFEQQTRLGVYADDTNPARIESERLYRRENPDGPFDRAATTRWWRARLMADIMAAPLDWAGLVARKAWYVLNNFEQYNNKTYFLHKLRSAWLRFNPLNWSIVLGLAVLGAAALGAGAPRRLFFLTAGAYVGGLLLTYASARFRLPLIAVGAVLAGGVCMQARPHWRRVAVAALVVGLSLVPPSLQDAERTLVQDYLLLARAALESGDGADAVAHAQTALARAPRHPAALELICVAGFNQWLRGVGPPLPATKSADSCARSAPDSPVAMRILAIQRWRAGDDVVACKLFAALAGAAGPEREQARAALVMLSGRAPCPALPAAWRNDTSDLVLLALAARGDATARAMISRRLPAAHIAREIDALNRTYERP